MLVFLHISIASFCQNERCLTISQSFNHLQAHLGSRLWKWIYILHFFFVRHVGIWSTNVSMISLSKLEVFFSKPQVFQNVMDDLKRPARSWWYRQRRWFIHLGNRAHTDEKIFDLDSWSQTTLTDNCWNQPSNTIKNVDISTICQF